MWELIANGLGLVGTGVSLVSGFSLDKRFDALNNSFEKLNTLQAQILERVDAHPLLPRNVLPLIDVFQATSDPIEQVKTARLMAEYSRQLQVQSESSTSALLSDVIAEMRSVIESVRFTQVSGQPAPRALTRTLYNDPFDAGIVEFHDITSRGMWGLNAPYVVSPHLSPISWCDPTTGRNFLGKISTSELRRYGINVTTPQYRHAIDGHIYSSSYGLYLPSYMVNVT